MNNKPLNILLDTDIGPDCDDVGALALLHGMADKGLAQILGIMHCTSNIYGAGCIDAINRYFGRTEIPVGTLKAEGFLNDEGCQKYNKYIAENYENTYINQPAQDATILYRKILSGQPDQSVVLISIGPLVNLSLLLKSQPDDISPLSGYELVKLKVRELVSMAGQFASDKADAPPAEWNVLVDIKAAQEVFHQWPTEVVFCGWETGDQVITGKRLMAECRTDNPVKKAYELFTKGEGRSSWDLIAVLYAFLRENELWELSQDGNVTISNEGVSYYEMKSGGRHRYLINRASASAIEQYIDNMLLEICLVR